MSPLSIFFAALFAIFAVVGFVACADARTDPEIERISLQEASEGRAVLQQKALTRAVKLFLQFAAESELIEPHSSAWVVSGRVMYSGVWHIITTTPASFESSRKAFNGLHNSLAGTPHQLSLLSLSNCADVSVLSSPNERQIPPR